MTDRHPTLALFSAMRPPALIALAIVLVFARIAAFAFVDFDDEMYVRGNAHIRDGLTLAGLFWALTSAYAANWHPLTWISHMVDIQLFGLWPGGHHLVSLLLHLAAVLALFKMLHEATQDLAPSAATAFLFGVHPLHVESVAWVSERKDVLCGLFWMLCLLAWGRYGRKGGPRWYLAAVLFFLLALLSKPMAVTLPFVLLIMDVWPLGRTGRGGLALVVEKLPLMALSAASILITLWAQHRWGALAAMDSYAPATRVANALVAYVSYIFKSLVPVGLGPYYPHPGTALAAWQVAGAAVLLVGVSSVCFGLRRGRAYLLAGWFWFLGTLVPVIGLVQVGSQAMADRYTYLPLVGLLLMGAWTGRHLSVPAARLWLTRAAMGAYAAVLVLTCYLQTGYWQDSLTLFQRMLVTGGPSAKAHHGLGLALARQGRGAQALVHFEAAVAIKPLDMRIRNDLGLALLARGMAGRAEAQFRQALAIDAAHANAWNNLGVALVEQQRLEEAIRCFERALELAPDAPGAAGNLDSARQALAAKKPPAD